MLPAPVLPAPLLPEPVPPVAVPPELLPPVVVPPEVPVFPAAGWTSTEASAWAPVVGLVRVAEYVPVITFEVPVNV